MKVGNLFICVANILKDMKCRGDQEKSQNEVFYILFYLSGFSRCRDILCGRVY